MNPPTAFQKMRDGRARAAIVRQRVIANMELECSTRIRKIEREAYLENRLVKKRYVPDAAKVGY